MCIKFSFMLFIHLFAGFLDFCPFFFSTGVKYQMILSWVHSVSFYKEHLYEEQYSKIKWTKETSTSCFEDKDKMRKKKSESQIFLRFSLFAIFLEIFEE